MISHNWTIAIFLFAVLTLVYIIASAHHRILQRMASFLPPLVLIYLLPGLFNSFGWINGRDNQVGYFAMRYFLPASLVLLTLGVNFSAIRSLGGKALLLFFAGTIGIVIGGPLALWIYSFFDGRVVADQGADSLWRGLVCITGAWINGTPGQLSMKQIFGASEELFFVIIAVDTIMQNAWLLLLFYAANRAISIDRWLKADPQLMEVVNEKMDRLHLKNQEVQLYQPIKIGPLMIPVPKFEILNLFHILAIGIGAVAFTYFLSIGVLSYTRTFTLADNSAWIFIKSEAFWLVLFSTSLGLILSATPANRLEAKGATAIGNFLLYFIIATLGMRMDIFQLSGGWSALGVCCIWLMIHLVILLIAAKLLKAPFFFVAVGSQANIGGPATASAVASAFRPELATVGVLLGVLSNIIGNYFALLAGYLFSAVG